MISTYFQTPPSGISSTCTPVKQPLVNTSSTPNSKLFEIPLSMVKDAAQGCRSRRNLAGRLADTIFTAEEKCTSNCRGVKKKQLDFQKTSAIRRACIAEFPGKQHETERMIEKEVREGIDEMCRRSTRKASTSTV